jgi:hypothetical protein
MEPKLAYLLPRSYVQPDSSINVVYLYIKFIYDQWQMLQFSGGNITIFCLSSDKIYTCH